MRRGWRVRTRSRRCAIFSSLKALTPVGAKVAFALGAFALAIIALFALERVGAPDSLVAALGPIAALIGVAGLGVLTRARTLLDFLAARRATPPFYAGLALAAVIGGFALAFAGAAEDATDLPWRGVGGGIVFAALAVAPRWRGRQASTVADVFATRFPSPFTRVAFALILCACGWGLATAGLGYAALSLRDSLGVGEDAALALSAVALVLSLAPGGLRSLVWTDAASGATGLLVIGLLLALSAQSGLDVQFGNVGAALGAWPAAPLVQEIAAAAAAASLFAFVHPALSVASSAAARRAGLTALVALGLGGAAAAALGDLAMKGPSDSALTALIAWLPAMALARAGLFAASRAVGLDLARASKRLSVLASRRMAMARGGVVVGAIVASFAARATAHPSGPLFFALALWLAFAAPSLALAALPGRNSGPAILAFAASVAAALGGRYVAFGNPSYGPDLLVGALGAGLAGLAAGLCVFALSPPSAPAAPLADPFVELPAEALR